MLAAPLERRRDGENLLFSHPGRRFDGGERGSPLGERSRLVDDEGVDGAQDLDRFGISKQHPHRRALARRHHDRHRGRESKRARAGDDEHRDRVDHRVGHGRLRTDRGPHDKRHDGGQHHRWHEVRGNDVGEALDGRTAALSLGDHRHDPRQERVVADFVGPHEEAAVAVERRADNGITGLFVHGNRLTGDHRLVDQARALDHAAVDRDFLARPHAHDITRAHLLQRHVALRSIVGDATCRGCGHAEQPLERGGGLAAGAQLEHLAEQDQGHDHGGCFEVHRDLSVGSTKRGRERAGGDDCDDAVAESHRDPEPDQREHVGAQVFHRADRTHVERPPRPQAHRGREQQLEVRPPTRGKHPGDRPARKHVEHRDGQQRGRQCRRKHEATRHVAQLGILFVVERDGVGLERHPTFGTVAESDLLDLGMHGTCEARARWRCFRLVGAPVEPTGGVAFELRATAGTTKAVHHSGVLVDVLAGFGHRHPADGIATFSSVWIVLGHLAAFSSCSSCRTRARARRSSRRDRSRRLPRTPPAHTSRCATAAEAC